MIKSNLNVKLAENNLKISKVYNDTGISRSTLATLATGDPKGIQLDTIDTLCRYLNITPGELFIYAPIDISITITDIEILEEDYLCQLFKRCSMIAYAIIGRFLLGFICFIGVPRYRMTS